MEDATECTQAVSVNRVAPSYLRKKTVFLARREKRSLMRNSSIKITFIYIHRHSHLCVYVIVHYIVSLDAYHHLELEKILN